MKAIFFACLVGAATLPVCASHAESFFLGEAEGWFWYESPPPIVAAAAPLPPSAPLEPSPAPDPLPPPAPAGPAPLSAAWFRENFQAYQDRAIDDPSPDNVRAFLLLQRVMMDKSSDFAQASQMVTMGDPLLDATAERPLSTVGVHAQDRAAFLARQAALKELAARTGLMFFFRSDCPHCHAMAPVVEHLAKRLGFSVVAVSVDGKGLPDGRFPEFRRDRGQAQTLGVATVPALFLAMPPDQIVTITQGGMAQESLERRILMSARQQGWISESSYDATLAFQRKTRVPNLQDMPQELLDDSRALTDYLRQTMRKDRPND